MSGAYVAFVLVAVVVPGAGLQRWMRLRVDPALVVPLGAVVAASAQALGLATGWPPLAACLVAVTAGGVLLGRPRFAERPPASVLPAALALLALLAATQWRGNLPAADGGFLLDPMGDQPLHAGLAWELTLPRPQVPGLAGVPLSYHVGADLVRAAALQWAGVRPYAPLNREEPALWALALMLALGSVSRRLGAPPLAVALVPFTVLMTDFSWLCALVPGMTWWSDVFRGNVLISMAFANPVVPALALALGALLALARHDAGEGRGWLLLASLQAAAVPWFKVFLGAQLAAGLLLAGALALRRRAGAVSGSGTAWVPLALGAIAAAATLPLVLGGTGEQVEVVVAPLRLVAGSLRQLGLEPGLAGLLLATAPWLVVSLGLRLAGVREAFRALLDGPAFAAAAAAVALAGWPLALLLHVAARDVEGQELPSATIYFVEQSGVFLWVFAAAALARTVARTRRPALTLAAVALLGVPSTVEFALRKAWVAPDPVPGAVVRALDAIARDGRPGDVVLQRPGGRYPPLPVVLAGRRVVYERFTPYLTQFAPARSCSAGTRPSSASSAPPTPRKRLRWRGGRSPVPVPLRGRPRPLRSLRAARAAPRGGGRARLPDRHPRAATIRGRRRRGKPHPRRAIIPQLRRVPTVDFVLNRKGGVPLHDQLLAQLEMKISGARSAPGRGCRPSARSRGASVSTPTPSRVRTAISRRRVTSSCAAGPASMSARTRPPRSRTRAGSTRSCGSPSPPRSARGSRAPRSAPRSSGGSAPRRPSAW